MKKIEIIETSENVKNINADMQLGKYIMNITTDGDMQKVIIRKKDKILYTGKCCIKDDWTENMAKMGIIAGTLDGIIEKRSMKLAKGLDKVITQVIKAGDKMYASLTQNEKERYATEYLQA